MVLQLDNSIANTTSLSGQRAAQPANPTAPGVALFYHPDGYETRRKQLMGRHAAGEAFLSAFIRYTDQQKYYCYSETPQQFQHFLGKVKDCSQGAKLCSWISWRDWRRLAEPGCLFMPSPTLKDLSWQRRSLGEGAYSLCGITHTTATQVVMDAVGDLLTAPVHPWDALICTSQSVKSMVQTILDNYGDYLRDRFKLRDTVRCQVQLPVIPLGVHCRDFDAAPPVRAANRARLRGVLKIADDEVAFLYVGRFSAYGKAHPVPMFIALQLAAAKLTRQIHLIMAGWFSTKEQQEDFIAAARQHCPSVKVHIVDGRNKDIRRNIWFAADVFTSLSDNIQETFGLTPVEAMAAGLPSVISDWDGYKETVRDGVDGFRVPTWMSAPGTGEALAFGYANRLLNYDQYVGTQSLYTVVDIQATARAYQKLAEDASLRQQMGEAARSYTHQVFDWSVVIKEYEALWIQISAIRKRLGQGMLAPSVPSPLRDDPTRLFAAYPTQHLGEQTQVVATDKLSMQNYELIKSLALNCPSEDLGAAREDSERIIPGLSSTPRELSELLAGLSAADQKRCQHTLLWLAKFGLAELRNGNSIRTQRTV